MAPTVAPTLQLAEVTVWSTTVAGGATRDVYVAPNDQAVFVVTNSTLTRLSSITGATEYAIAIPPVDNTSMVQTIAPLAVSTNAITRMADFVVVSVNDDNNRGRVIAYNATTQQELWTLVTVGPPNFGFNLGYIAGTPRLSADGSTMYVCQVFGPITAVNTTDGSIIWQQFSLIWEMEAIALSPLEDKVFIQTGAPMVGENGIHAYNAELGQLVDSVSLTTRSMGPTVDKDDFVYVAETDGSVSKFNGKDLQGRALWRQEVTNMTSSPGLAHPILSTDSAFVFAPVANQMAKLDVVTGLPEWNVDVGGTQTYDPTVSLNGRWVFVLVDSVLGQSSAKLTKLDTSTGGAF